MKLDYLDIGDRVRRSVIATDFADGLGEEWVVEGKGEVFARDGKMIVASAEAATTIWHTKRLHGDVLVTFAAHVDEPELAANINAFVHANDPSGTPIHEGKRSGAYGEYHRLMLYIFTLTGFYAPNPKAIGWSRVRKDPGFHLLSENLDTKARTGETYAITILIEGERIRYYVNGRLVHDCRDPDPYTSGWFALRTWNTNLSISEVRIWELEP